MSVLKYSVSIFIIKTSTLYNKILDNRPNLKKVLTKGFFNSFMYIGYKENFNFVGFSSGDFSYNKINSSRINVYIAIWLDIVTNHVQLKNDLETKNVIHKYRVIVMHKRCYCQAY